MDLINKIEEFIKILNDYNQFDEAKLPTTDKGCMAVMSKLFMKKEMYSCQLAKELKLSRARLSSIIKNLKQKQYVSLHFNIKDKRKIFIRITEEGTRIVKETYNKTIEKLKKLFEKLGEEKTDLMIGLTKEVIEIYRQNEKEEQYA